MAPAPADAAAEPAVRSPVDQNAELVRMMNLNLRYILNTWWPSEKDYVYAAATNTNSDRQLTEERQLAVRNSAQTFAGRAMRFITSATSWRTP